MIVYGAAFYVLIRIIRAFSRVMVRNHHGKEEINKK
jgi:hypothetical protein